MTVPNLDDDWGPIVPLDNSADDGWGPVVPVSPEKSEADYQKESIQAAVDADNPINFAKSLGSDVLGMGASAMENMGKSPLSMMMPGAGTIAGAFLPEWTPEATKPGQEAVRGLGTTLRGASESLSSTLPESFHQGLLSGVVDKPVEPGIPQSAYNFADSLTSPAGVTNLAATSVAGLPAIMGMLPGMAQGVGHAGETLIDPSTTTGQKLGAGTDIAAQILPAVFAHYLGKVGKGSVPEVPPNDGAAPGGGGYSGGVKPAEALVPTEPSVHSTIPLNDATTNAGIQNKFYQDMIEQYTAKAMNLDGPLALPAKGQTTGNFPALEPVGGLPLPQVPQLPQTATPAPPSVLALPESLNPQAPLPTAPPYGPGVDNFGLQKIFNLKNKADLLKMDPDTLQALFPGKALPKGMPLPMPETQTGTKLLPPATELPPTFSGPSSLGASSDVPPPVDPNFAKQTMVPPVSPETAQIGPSTVPPEFNASFAKQVMVPPENPNLPTEFYHGKPGPQGEVRPTLLREDLPTDFRATKLHPEKSWLEVAVEKETRPQVKKSLYEFQDTRPPSYDAMTPEEKVKYWESGKKPSSSRESSVGVTEGKKGFAAAYIHAAKNVIKHMGPAGENIVNRVNAARSDHQTLVGNWNTQFTEVIKNVSDADFKRASQYIEGDTRSPITPTQRATATQIESLLKQVEGVASQALPDFQGRQQYFPHSGTPEFYDFLTTKKGQEFYESWAKTKMPKLSDAEVGEVIQRLLAKDRGFDFGSLSKERLDVIPEKYLRRDKAVIWEYLDNAAKYIAETKHLGKDSTILTSLADDIMNSSDRSFAHQVISQDLAGNKPAKGFDKVQQGWRRFNTVTLLGPVTSVRNWMQRGNLFGVAGLSPLQVMKAFGSVYTDEGKAFAKLSGVVKQGDLGSAAEMGLGVGNGGKVSKYLKAVGVSKSETGNRIASANAGKYLAQDLFKILKKGEKDYRDFARNTLTELGVNVDQAMKTGSLSPRDIIAAAQKVTGDVNFYSGTFDVPQKFHASQTTKTIAQFKDAAHQQSQFIGKVIGDVVKYPRKATLNALYLMAFLQVAGEIHGDISAGIRGKDRPDNLLGRVADNFVSGPGFGLLADSLRSASVPGFAANSVLGPSYGGIVEGLTNAIQAGQGKPKALTKQVMSRVPVVGPVLPRVFSK